MTTIERLMSETQRRWPKNPVIYKQDVSGHWWKLLRGESVATLALASELSPLPYWTGVFGSSKEVPS